MYRFLLLGILAFACKNAQVSEPKEKSGQRSKEKTEAFEKDAKRSGEQQPIQGEGNEVADRPGTVSGAYLACAIANDPKLELKELLVGCRMQDKSEKRVILSDIAQTVVYSYETPPDSDVTVTVQGLPHDPVFDVVYVFKSEDPKTTKEAALNTEIQVAFEKLKNGEEKAGISAKLSNVLYKAWAYIVEYKDAAVAKYAEYSAAAGGFKDYAKDVLQQTPEAIKESTKNMADKFKGLFGLQIKD